MGSSFLCGDGDREPRLGALLPRDRDESGVPERDRDILLPIILEQQGLTSSLIVLGDSASEVNHVEGVFPPRAVIIIFWINLYA